MPSIKSTKSCPICYYDIYALAECKTPRIIQFLQVPHILILIVKGALICFTADTELNFFAVSCVVCEGLKTEDLKALYLKSENSKYTFMRWERKDLVIDQVLADGNLFCEVCV